MRNNGLTALCPAEHVRWAVELIGSGAVPANKLATHLLPLDGIFDAFDLTSSGAALRVVLEPCHANHANTRCAVRRR